MGTQRETLIKQFEEARRQLTALVDQAPTHKWIYPHWTIKEYIDHLSGWDDAIVEALEARPRNDAIPQSAARGINAYNAQTIKRRETLDLAHSRSKFTVGHERVIGVLQDLPDERFDQPVVFPWGESGTVYEFIDIFIEHDKEHTGDLATWLKNPDKTLGEHS